MLAISSVFSYAPHGSQSDYNAALAADLERVLIDYFKKRTISRRGSRRGNYNGFIFCMLFQSIKSFRNAATNTAALTAAAAARYFCCIDQQRKLHLKYVVPLNKFLFH